MEDSEIDADLLLHELNFRGYDVTARRVETADAMRAALQRESWQAIISDYTLPGFSGPAALAVLKEANLDVPFIIVSGTINEEMAVGSLKAGAADFLLKGNLARLVPAVERGIREAQLRRERATLEQQFRQSEDRSTYALAAAGAGIWELDLLSGTTRVSDVVASMLGLPVCPAEIARDEFRRRIYPDDLMVIDQAISRSIESDEPYRADFRAVWPDGAIHWITAKGRVSRNPDGQPLSVTGIAIDVSERKELEQQLQQSQKLEGIGRLAGGIAHDFNNLLTAIIGYTEMVLDQIGQDKPISQDLQEIRKASDRAVSLTRQLLAFSRKQTLHVASLDLNEIIRSMHNMLQRLIGADVEIHLELGPRSSPVRADRVQLEQVLLNLVMNARDAMPGGGVITIDTLAVESGEAIAVVHEPVSPGPYARLRVRDSGIGMDAATRDRIFEPFFTTKAVGKGTGLGLATVYGVVQQLGGHIAVSSEKSKGTTFTLYFPEAVTGSAIPDHTRPRTASPLAERREIVLVVDDEQGVRQLVSRILTRHGYTVLEAADATHAIAVTENHPGPIDLVVSDVVMPTVSGPELVTRLRATRPIKVLYMSGYVGQDLSNRASLDDTTTVLEKPFTASVLLQTVRDVLDDRATYTYSLEADSAPQ